MNTTMMDYSTQLGSYPYNISDTIKWDALEIRNIVAENIIR